MKINIRPDQMTDNNITTVEVACAHVLTAARQFELNQTEHAVGAAAVFSYSFLYRFELLLGQLTSCMEKDMIPDLENYATWLELALLNIRHIAGSRRAFRNKLHKIRADLTLYPDVLQIDKPAFVAGIYTEKYGDFLSKCEEINSTDAHLSPVDIMAFQRSMFMLV